MKNKCLKGAILFGGLAFGLVVLFSILRDTIKVTEDIAEFLDTRCIATIPHESLNKTFRTKLKKKNKGLLISNAVISLGFEQGIRKIHMVLENYIDKNVFVFTSARENEGKSTIVANVALSMAREGKTVLLIDADMRKPALYKIFEIADISDADFSLSKFLKDDQCGFIIHYQKIHCMLNKEKREDSTELLSSEKMGDLLRYYREKYDYILIDTPPVINISDAAILTNIADGVIMVVREDFTPYPQINESISILQKIDRKKVLGCIYNNASRSNRDSYIDKEYGYYARF